MPGRAIDYMKKSDLAAVATKNLGLSLAQANVHTEHELKSKIRTALQSVIGRKEDLRRKKKTELRDEVHKRGLPVIPNAIHVQMEMQIQEDADARARTWLSTAATNAEARSTSTVDEDYEMIPGLGWCDEVGWCRRWTMRQWTMHQHQGWVRGAIESAQ